MSSETETYFLPTKRSSMSQLDLEIKAICAHSVVIQLMRSVRGAVIILNPNRQIVAANRIFIEKFGLYSLEELLGQRPGEAVGCRHASKAPGGCGTGRPCRNCGAELAIKESREKSSLVERECTITREDSSSGLTTLALDVHTAPIVIDDHLYTLVTLFDIQKQKRQETLQRAFFHDILNAICGLNGLCQLLEGSPGIPDPGVIRVMREATEYLTESVYSQRDLLAMEDGRYLTETKKISVANLFEKVDVLLSASGVTKAKTLNFDGSKSELNIVTDITLLVRVLVNMIKNALEAVTQDEVVEVSVSERGDTVRFEVTNPGQIPSEIADRIFEKHFSTKKGIGRGIGTWGMKFIGEQYLGGEVGFHCTENKVCFHIEIPRNCENELDDADEKAANVRAIAGFSSAF